MREITQDQFNETLKSVLCEVFEFFGQPYYLEVLTNETDFVGRVVELPEEYHNLSCVFEYDPFASDSRYAFQSEPNAKKTLYAYDSLAEARQHAAQLLDESLKRLSIV